jgi:exosortase/archaeosortase family protein
MILAKRITIRPAKRSALKIRARLVPAMAAFVLALVLLSQTPGTASVLETLDVLTASVTATLLKLSGMPVYQDAAVLSHLAGFSYEIYYKCTGLILALFLSAALLTLPGRWTSRGMNIFFGAAMVFALNFVRLVSLFYIGVLYPQAFDFFHTVFWEVIMLVFVLAFWLWSMRRAEVKKAEKEKR